MKLITYEERIARRPKSRRAIRPYRLRKIIDKAPYIRLKCGDITTPEVVELTRVWQPKRGKYFCENCGKWVNKIPAVKPQALPAEPLF